MRRISTILTALLALISTSCVEDDIYGLCTISNISNTTAYTAADSVIVSATVTSLISVQSVELTYNVNNGSNTQVSMNASSSVYTGTIPAQAVDAVVSYFITAKSADGDISTSNSTSYTVGATPINYDGLVLNELNGNDKFIELYNKGTEAIPLAGCQLFKDSGTDATWTCDSRTLNAGEFLLLYSEDVVATGGAQEGYEDALVFHSGLSAKKAIRIELKSPAGNPIDDFNLATCVTPATASYTRVPNGTGSWYHTTATPGTANTNDTTTPVAGLEGGDPVYGELTDIVINELNGSTKFIELYNKGSKPVQINGCYMIKDESATDTTWMAADLTINAGAFLLLYSEDVTATGGAQEGYNANLTFHSGLSGKKSVAFQLFSPEGTQIDAFARGGELNASNSWGTTIANSGTSSFARCPNGTGNFKLADATPGAANPDTGDDIPQSK